MRRLSRRDFIKLSLAAPAALATGAQGESSASAETHRQPMSKGANMSADSESLVRGYLLHLTHYDPHWCGSKSAEKPFDLDVALEVVDALAAERFNLLAIDCADAVTYSSHPELARHYTVPMARLESLSSAARERGLDVVPKLNFSRSQYHHHNDWMLAPDEPWHKHFDDDAYWKKAFELVDELIAVCQPQQFFHVGMDEDHDRAYTQYIEAIKALYNGLKQRNLRTIIWNDTAIEYPPGLIHAEKSLAAEKAIPKDIVQVLWDYHSVPAAAARRICEEGFELWGAPGAHDRSQAAGFRDVVLSSGGKGLFMTTWSPCVESNRDRLLRTIHQIGPLYRGEA